MAYDLDLEPYEFKTGKGTLVIEQASFDQEEENRKKLKEIEDRDITDVKALYEQNVDFLKKLGGDETLIRSLSTKNFLKVVSGEEEKK